MPFEIIITAVICPIISGVISWFIAKTATKSEIKKLRETWAHEKETAIDAEFDNLVAAVSYFAGHNDPNSYQGAVKAVAVYRSKATGEMADIIDALSAEISRTANADAIRKRLNDAVKIKRGEQG